MNKEWDNVWGKQRGHPNVILAVDGSSILGIDRPDDYEGFYSKNGTPGLNMQACVDAKKRFRFISIRAGSCNDQSMWNMSMFGINIGSIIPYGYVILGDAGYR